MRKILLVVCLALVTEMMGVRMALAVTKNPTPSVATATATIVLVPTMPKEVITEPGNQESTYRLESVLEKNRSGKWNGVNTLSKLVEVAVDRGVSANTVVLLFLLPLIATLVSVLHYVLGLSGYGIFMPTMIAVSFLATGFAGGLILFASILAISLLSNMLLRKWKLHFWPARSIGLMLIAMGTFGLMLVSSYFEFFNISRISIFPILFMILLTEEFTRTQLAKSKNEAKKLMLGTLVLAIFGAATMRMRPIQESVLLHPGISLIIGLVVNLVVGSYTGIRLSEISRFKNAIRAKKIFKKK